MFCTSKVHQHSVVVIGNRRPPLVKNEFISGSSVLNHRFPARWLEGGRAVSKAIYHQRGRLAAVNGQEAFGRRVVKKGKKTRPPLSNKLIKSYPNRRAENLTHSSGLWGEIFRREGGGGCWRKKVGNDRGRGGFDVGKTESGGLGHNKRQ